MDVARLLEEICERRKWSLTELAARGGSSRATLRAYMSGSVSPSVRTLTRILAAAGYQLRVELEPWLADVDERVDALLAGEAKVDVAEVERFVAVASEEQAWGWEDPETRESGERRGTISWALDGATALNAHGLACPQDALSIVLLLDDPARSWLTRGMVRGTAPVEPVGWWSATPDQARTVLAELAVGRYGLLRIRPVDELPAVMEVRLPGGETLVPIVSVDEVERTQAALAEVLERLRARRGEQGRT